MRPPYQDDKIKKRKKIIFIDPRNSYHDLITKLRKSCWEIEEIVSHKYNTHMTINKASLSQVAFALSGSDYGISIAHSINSQLGLLAKDINPAVFYNKIEQHHYLSNNFPQFAFKDSYYFASKDQLKSYLNNSNSMVLIRPEISYVNGSSILYNGNYSAIDNDINCLFQRAKRVITHPFIEGTSFFINGIIFDGQLFLTDAWQCFNKLANNRNILTSVISISVQEQVIQQIKYYLDEILPVFSIKFSPIHFELIFNNNNIQIVKIVPRLASEPLPTLSHLSGVDGQTNVFHNLMLQPHNSAPFANIQLTKFVGDYSFIVRKSNYLCKNNLLANVYQLPSYYQTYYLPSQGMLLDKTVCGATYGATVLLANTSREQLVNDIETCQKLNDDNFFN